MKTLLLLVQSLRPRQWTKNLVVFAGLVFSLKFFYPDLVLKTVQAFVIFCLAAGVVYLFNDIQDRAGDRLHPDKKRRPIASGALSVEIAGLADILLLTITLGWAFSLSTLFGLTVAAYLLLNLAYTLGLKRLVILDVFTVSAGFVLRAAAGAVVIAVDISPWLLVVATLLSLFLGFAKRRHELIILGAAAAKHRSSLAHYSPELLDQFMSVVASSTIIAYSLYAFNSSTARAHHALMLTVPFVIYGILRYLYLVYQRKLGGSPEMVLLTDAPMLVTIVLWIVSVGLTLR